MRGGDGSTECSDSEGGNRRRTAQRVNHLGSTVPGAGVGPAVQAPGARSGAREPGSSQASRLPTQ